MYQYILIIAISVINIIILIWLLDNTLFLGVDLDSEIFNSSALKTIITIIIFLRLSPVLLPFVIPLEHLGTSSFFLSSIYIYHSLLFFFL